MNLKLQMNDETDPIELFEQADQLRNEALQKLRSAGEFYHDVLSRFPERCDFSMTHQRGRVEAMSWQVHQLCAMSSPFYSQAGQDRYLDHYLFEGKQHGVFLEVGGYDGVSGSNCLFFETIRKWSGLMIEPSPQNMAHARLLRSCNCLEVAIGPEEGNGEFINIIDGASMMSRLSNKVNEELAAIRTHPGYQEEVINVPVQRLDSVLRNNGLKKIDYCSFDVQGIEAEILEKFPFGEFDISVWSIENASEKTDILEIMMDNNYEFVTVVGIDEIYQKVGRQI